MNSCFGFSARAARLIGAGVLGGCCLAAASTSAANQDDDEVAATSLPQVEERLKRLRKRVRQLESQVAALETLHLPVEADVDCGEGGSISEVLAANAEGEGLLTIRVSGSCTEAVKITRSDVVIQGEGPATVIQAPPTVLFTLTVDGNVGNVVLEDVTVTGGVTAAVLANKGAHLLVRDVVVQQGVSGVMALDNRVMDVTRSAIRNNTAQGAYAARGGVISQQHGRGEYARRACVEGGRHHLHQQYA